MKQVSEEDEKSLDRYEGFPTFYYKKEMKLLVKGIESGKRRWRKCFVYIMHEERKIGVPSYTYIRTCLEGYRDFGFDTQYLMEAKHMAEETVNIERWY